MRHIFFLLFFSFSSLAYPQPTLHAGARLGGLPHLYTYPYENDEDPIYNTVPIAPVFELGYDFCSWLSVRAFYHWQNSERSELVLSSYSAKSQMHFLGIRPQFKLFSFSNSRFNFVLGLPAEFGQQSLNWKMQYSKSFFGSPDSAAGQDQASVFRLGLSPTVQFKPKNSKFIFEASLACYQNWLSSYGREVHFNSFYPETFADKQGRINSITVELRISIGYSLW